jgi:hypothetical protein
MGIVLYRMYHMVSCFLAGLCCEPCLLTSPSLMCNGLRRYLLHYQ